MGRPPRPPWLVRWALRLLLAPDDRRSALSELGELYERRRLRDGERAAGAWLSRQHSQYPWRLLRERLRTGRNLPPAGATGNPRRAGHYPVYPADGPGEPMHNLLRDLRHSLRSLARTPALSATIILTVGLGLGATTAIYSVIHAVLLAPLPYSDPDRLVRIYTDSPPNRWSLSVADYLALEEQQTTFEQVAGSTRAIMTLQRGEVVERLPGRVVTWSYFRLLGIEPARGRVFDESDGVPGSQPAVVVSHGFWTRYLDGEEAAVGRTVSLDERGYTVVGVLPAEVGPLEEGAEFFAVAQWEPPPRRGPFFVTALGRVAKGIGRASAEEELRAINKRIFPLWEDTYSDSRATWGAMDLEEHVIGDVGPTLALVFGAVAFVLLIACANAANLLVARALHRRRELAVRGALGASRGRLLQHLLAESALLALGAAGVGLALAAGAIELVAAAGGDYLPRAREVALSGPVIGFLVAVAVGSGLLFGLIPALAGARSRLAASLPAGGRTATGGTGARRLRRVLVAGQFAVATPLLIASALLVGSLANLRRVDPGFDSDDLLTAAVTLPATRYPESQDVLAFWQEAERRLEALPGVEGVALADGRPPREVSMVNNFDLEDDPTPPGASEPSTPWVAVTPDYFELMGIALLDGRLLDRRDDGSAPEVVVVDRAWAERFFPGGDAVGSRLHAGGSSTWATVVGVVSEVKYGGIDKPERGTVYWPVSQRATSHPIERLSARFAYLVVRTSVDPAGVLPQVRTALRELDPGLPLTGVATMEELLAGSLEVPRLLSVLVAAFAAVALLLSVVGIYGVMAYFVQQHRREIGIRLALGGRPSLVRRMIVGQGLGVVVAGVVVGLGAAFLLTRSLSSLLFEIGATDPSTYLGVAALMLGTAAAACLLPARRAARVEPATTLREE